MPRNKQEITNAYHFEIGKFPTVVETIALTFKSKDKETVKFFQPKTILFDQYAICCN